MDSPTRRRAPSSNTILAQRKTKKWTEITLSQDRKASTMLKLSPFKRTTTLVVGAILMLCGGTPYMVSLFTSVFEERMGFSVTQTILVETCTHVGLYCGITQGIIYDKFGLKIASAMAGALLVCGYLGAFFATMKPNGAIVMGFCFFLIGQGSHGLYTIAASTNIRNFKTANKGKVMGLLAATFAISGAIFTPVAWQFGVQVSHPVRNTSEVHTCSDIVTPVNATPSANELHDFSQADPIYYFAFMAALMAFAGLLAGTCMFREPEKILTTELMTELLDTMGNDNDDDDDGDDDVVVDQSPIADEVDIYGFQLLLDHRFLLLFVCMMVEDGTGVMFNNAIASIYKSIEIDAPNTPAPGTLLIVFSVTSATGRAFWGVVADFFPRRRALVLLCTMVLMGLSHLWMVVLPHELLLATIGVGFSFGGMFAIAPVITSELFGNKHFGTNWGCVVFAAAAGSTTFNMLFGVNYDANTPAGCTECIGQDCFQSTFIITTICLSIGVVLNFLLDRSMSQSARNCCGPNYASSPAKANYKALETASTIA